MIGDHCLSPQLLQARAEIEALVGHLIREGKLEGQESLSTTGRRFTIVRRDQLEQISAQLTGEITMGDAMELLGIGKVRMQRILKLLFPSARRTGDKAYLPWCVPRGEVEALLVLGSHLPVVGIPEEHQVSLGHVLKYWNWTGEQIVTLIESVKTGAIVLQAQLDSMRGICCWIFDIAQLRALQRAMDSGRSNWVNIPEMGRILGIKQQVAYWLVHHGFIRFERLGRGSRIHRQEIERFRQNYVFGVEIAALLGHSSRKVMEMLSAQGIYPLRGEGVRLCRQLVYARDDRVQYFIEQVGLPHESFRLVTSGEKR